MSSSEEENNDTNDKNNNDDNNDDSPVSIDEPDEDTLRVMISTDNHLGYYETDPVRGLDSFAAFEEVLYLAKLHKVDMVLLGGDLFHHNKPSRRTLHKTMEIVRRYTMGPNPVKIQILSDQEKDFRSVHGQVNYEDSCYSVDLPIFSIHGNHDDPTRDGGNEMLAALDLLSVSNLINYFGRQEEVDKVEVSPVLLAKGSTRVALYGLGNMRDERLNRMWQSKKVRFLRPEGATDRNGDQDSDDGEDGEKQEKEWFNIFVLHQNRDNTGRGTKNCVHESMIPAWVDFVVFGHEHSSEPHAVESLVGTFRISQPGSSVATSLTTGEAARKHCVLLNVRGTQFRMDPIPLTMVRSFVMHDVVLDDSVGLRDDDPKVDSKISRYLEEQLGTWIYNAKEKGKQLLLDAKEKGNNAADPNSPLKYRLQKRDEVLVRLRVDHGLFSTLNNQRFGARFVGQVANPTDILLFQKSKRKAQGSGGGGRPNKKNSKVSDYLDDPVIPAEIDPITVSRLVQGNLERTDTKMSILTEKEMQMALEMFVDKSEAGAILEKATSVLKKRQKSLMRSGTADADGKVETTDDVVKALERQSQANDRDKEKDDRAAAKPLKRKRANSKSSSNMDSDDDDDDGDDDELEEAKGKKNKIKGKRSQSQKSNSISIDSSDDDDDDEEEPVITSTQRSKKSTTAAKKKSSGGGRRSSGGDIRSFMSSQSQSQSQTQSSTKKKRKKPPSNDEDDLDDDDEIEVVTVKRAAAPRRRTAKGKVNYSVDAGSDKDSEDSDKDDDMMDSSPPKKKAPRSRKPAPAARGKSPKRGRKGKSQESLDDDWGSASTRTQR